jgi:hypothetical protein
VSTKVSRFVVVSLLVCTGSLGAAFAQCNAPASDGIQICFPNNGSAVTYPPPMEMGVKTKTGRVRTAKVWDNGKLRDTFNFVPGTLFDGAIKNGTHRVTIQVYDTDGNFYQAQRTFLVTGFGVDFCSVPSTPGVNLCWPSQGSLQPNNIPISATAKGQGTAKITSLVVYLDGTKVLTSNNNFILSGSESTAGNHKVTVVAKDSAGHKFQTSHTFTAFYQQDCNPKTGECSPGIVINKPVGGPDVPESFTFQADVQNNPAPTTSMKLFVDGSVVATSTGPGITKQLKLAKNSTHIISVRATDTQGKQYATYQTYFVH